ncbi:MAG TPA: hemerythrin domain-containing protein [Pirellulales bacterium]|nr:hemerythrin domain-containing protein [Pirellulales bacterium]
MTDESHRAFISAFGTEHHELRQLVQAIRAVVRDERPWSHEAVAEVVELLASLETHLHHHFAQEEAGGYLEEVLSLAPRFSDEVAELLRQHPQMLDKTRLVYKTAGRAVHESSAWPQLKRELRELIEALIAHESEENKIVQQAFNTGLEDLD